MSKIYGYDTNIYETSIGNIRDSKEIKVKVSIPMFEDGELERFDDNIHNIASEFTKMHLKEKDMILSQRLVMKLEEENTKLQERIDKAIEYIKNNFADVDYMRSRYSEQDVNTHIAEIPITDIEKLLNILKGVENEK